MTQRERITRAVYDAIDEINEQLPRARRLGKSTEAALLGPGGRLDSLGVVSLIAATQQKIEEALCVRFTLADGELISIDLPTVEAIEGSTHRMPEVCLPPGFAPGWVIPDRLRGRHRLELGDSMQLLPAVSNRHPTIDIFFHDSLHTFQHQHYEYSVAWPHLAQGRILLRDDILWSAAFHRLCREQRGPYVRVSGGGFGAVMK